ARVRKLARSSRVLEHAESDGGLRARLIALPGDVEDVGHRFGGRRAGWFRLASAGDRSAEERLAATYRPLLSIVARECIDDPPKVAFWMAAGVRSQASPPELPE